MKVSNKITRSIVFLALLAVSGTTRFLPWRLGVQFGGLLGRIAFYLLRRERGRSLEGLRIAFGRDKSEKELNKIARRNFQNLGKGLIEILNFRYLTLRRIESLVTIEGEEYLKEAKSNGKGTVLITGHIGNWELMAAALSLRGYRLHVIAAPLYDPRIDELIIRLRSKFNIETISRGSPSSSKKILGVLRKKEILGLLIDQDTQVNGVFVNFFNQKAYTPAGAAQLALKSGAATITCFVTRLPNDRHKITINKPITLVRSDDNKKDIEVNTAIFTAKIEEHIKQYPEQWVWMHRRWKTQPPAAKG
ncbi:MAG: lysophospholipid acyltransferase family protein [Nitrospira sp.]